MMREDDDLSLRADYTYTDAVDAVARTQLLRRPRDKLSVTADWRPLPELSLDASLLVTGPQADIGRESFANEKLAGYTTVRLAVSYRMTDMWTLFGRVENASDTCYQSPDGFQRPGIGAYAGIKANF